jgi:hypothetical protein
MHEKYLRHYKGNEEILRLMRDIKATFGKWSGASEKAFFEIFQYIDSISRLEVDADAPYKSNPYRSGTVVIPIAAFGGMARKVWKEERIRFDYLCSGPHFDRYEKEGDKRTLRQELLDCYYKLYTIDFTNGGKEMGKEKLEQLYTELLQAIFFILEKFQAPPIEVHI